jgi:hypothetical protein
MRNLIIFLSIRYRQVEPVGENKMSGADRSFGDTINALKIVIENLGR